MNCFSIRKIRNLIILSLTVMMSIIFVACSERYLPKEERKLTDEQIKQEIILPLYTSALLYSWDNADHIDVFNLGDFLISKFLISNNIKYKDAETWYYRIPKDIFEKEINKYFDVSEEHLRSWWKYDKDQKIYECHSNVWLDDFYENSDEIDKYKDTIEIKGVSKENGNKVIDFKTITPEGFPFFYKLTVDDTKDDIKYISLNVTGKDYFSLYYSMSVVGVDYEFEKSTDLNSGQLFSYAMFELDGEKILMDNWDKWIGDWKEDGEGGWTGEGIPLSVIEDVLTKRLGEYNFNPEEIDCYDKDNQVFKCGIGGYGGVRFLKLREKTMEGDILTLVIDHVSPPEDEQSEEEICQTVYIKFKINDDYSYKLLSIKKEDYD